ncbi:hypothetical protein [Moraxella bovis]|nr:hypothetical protein [Moraxella bovis]UYZ75305.1 hypothetical protein LP093_11235 [Moraxella bovis]UYZ87244.1 hypothetical protein LP094_02625 [Moraxella bovis]UZA40907.1 hypothetical protein LP112_02590 [Moraxella bovis]UZA63456.1 hypothetical protein LP096_13345 [Moraxella bovis]
MMFIDTAVAQVAHDLPIKAGVLIITLLLMAVMGMPWWQSAMVGVVWAVCLWMDKMRAIPIHELSTHAPDDVWYLGMYDGVDRQVWQAYLSDVVVMGRRVTMTFRVVVPFEITHRVTIHHRMMSEQDFRRLASLKI